MLLSAVSRAESRFNSDIARCAEYFGEHNVAACFQLDLALLTADDSTLGHLQNAWQGRLLIGTGEHADAAGTAG
ncbi:MAG: hypothetical protein ACKPJD_14195, partial [Planctomycetaceae bacterium]